MRKSALGYFIGIVPCTGCDRWLVVMFGKNGHWRSIHKTATEAAAKEHRAGWYRLHRKLAKKQRRNPT